METQRSQTATPEISRPKKFRVFSEQNPDPMEEVLLDFVGASTGKFVMMLLAVIVLVVLISYVILPMFDTQTGKHGIILWSYIDNTMNSNV